MEEDDMLGEGEGGIFVIMWCAMDMTETFDENISVKQINTWRYNNAGGHSNVTSMGEGIQKKM